MAGTKCGIHKNLAKDHGQEIAPARLQGVGEKAGQASILLTKTRHRRLSRTYQRNAVTRYKVEKARTRSGSAPDRRGYPIRAQSKAIGFDRTEQRPDARTRLSAASKKTPRRHLGSKSASHREIGRAHV